VAPAKVIEVCSYLRDNEQLAFNYMECLSGVDYPDKNQIAVVYHLFSYSKKHRVVVKAFVPRDCPEIQSVNEIWSAANWQERECFDLLGVNFIGHPDLRRIMLPDDWTGHPLRKDYSEQAQYHGIPTSRPNPLELLALKPTAKTADKKEAAEK
jgi:NADH-quinone oxidoreductase subunit C